MDTDKKGDDALMEFDEINVVTEKILGCAFKVSNTLGEGL